MVGVTGAEQALRRIREAATHIRSAGGSKLTPEAAYIVREVDAALGGEETMSTFDRFLLEPADVADIAKEVLADGYHALQHKFYVQEGRIVHDDPRCPLCALARAALARAGEEA